MANGYYKALYKAYTAWKKDNTKTSTSNNVESRIKSANKKLKSQNIDTDTRNFVEKALGLPDDQNILFDFFELLGRPQQALFGAIDAHYTGDDIGKAAWEHFKGDKRTYAKDLLEYDEKLVANDRKGKIDLIDVLGFTGDVVLDPVDLIPVAGFKKAGDIYQSTKSVKQASKALRSTSDVVMSGMLKGAKGVARGADNVVSSTLKGIDASKGIKYTNPAAKSAANLGKTIDANKMVDIAEDLIKKNGNRGINSVDALAAELSREAKRSGLLESYVDIKDRINRSFNYKANVPDEVIDGIRKANANEAKAGEELGVIQKALTEEIDNYARKIAEETGNLGSDSFDSIRNQLDKALVDFHEYRHLDRTTELKDVLEDAYKGRLSVKAASNDGIIEKLTSLADDLPVEDYGLNLSIDTSGKYVKLGDDWKYILNPSKKNIRELAGKIGGEAAQHVSEMSMDAGKLHQKVTRGAAYSDKTLEQFAILDKLYETDADFKKLVDLEESVYNASNAILNDRFGTALKTGVSAIDNSDLDKLKKVYSIKGVSKNSKIYDLINKVSASNIKNKDEILQILNKFADNGYGNLNLKSAISRAEAFMDDNLGYVRHAFMGDVADVLKGDSGVLKNFEDVITVGNTSIANKRKYPMSILETNEMIVDYFKSNFDMYNSYQKEIVQSIIDNGGIFKDSAIASFNDYLFNYPKLAKDSKVLDEVLVKSTFHDVEKVKNLENKIRKARKAGDVKLAKSLEIEKLNAMDSSAVKYLSNADEAVPYNYRVLTKAETESIARKFERLGDALGLEDLKGVGQYMKSNASNIAINKDVLRLIDINSNRKAANGMSRLYDSMMNFFKRNKTLSPTFQINNFTGNTSNMFLSGMSPTEIAKAYPEAVEVMTQHNKIRNKSLSGAKLTRKEAEILKIWDEFTEAGFGNVRAKSSAQLADMPESLRKYFLEDKAPKNVKELLVDGLPYLNLKANEAGDTAARLATYIHGRKNPTYLDNLGVKSAGEAVRKVLFDPSELTSFEQNVMKKIIPFYTFTKKNLAFQIDNIGRHGKQYNQLVKAYNGLWNMVLEDEDVDVDEWLRTNFYLPIPALKEDGSYTVIKTTLPFGELVEFAGDPLGKLSGSLTPLAKMPIELTTNTNTFTGSPIESYPGQMSKNIPFLTKKQEYLLGGITGLDVPVKNAVNIYNGINETMNSGGNVFEGIGRGVANTFTIDRNIETDRLNSMYDELDRLEQLISKYKDKGYDFSNENELIKANDNSTIKKVNAVMDKIRGKK
jgi:hypothetical protein